MTTNNNQMMNPMMADFTAMQVSGRALNRASKTIHAAQQAADELAGLNTMRGGAKGFKGFVGESMEAFESNAVGRSTQVLNNNGPADLLHTKANGETTLKQMKIGYKPKQIDFNKYRGQTVVVDADNPNFAAIKAEGAKCGVKVVKGHVTEAEAKRWAEAMQLESKITGSKNAVLVPKAYEGLQVAKAAHAAGMRAASVGAKSGAGFSIGDNLVQVAKGNKTVGEAAESFVIDTAKAGAISYGTGAAAGIIGSTEAGAAAFGVLGTAGTAVAEAPIIGTALGAAGTAAGTIGAAGTAAATAAAGAATSAVTAAAGAATGLAAGTAAAGAVGAAAAAATAATAAIGAAAVAAAPVLAVGAAIGGIYSLFHD